MKICLNQHELLRLPRQGPHSSLPLFDDLFIKIIWVVCNLIKMLNVLFSLPSYTPTPTHPSVQPEPPGKGAKNHIIEMINNRSEMRIMWDSMLCSGSSLMEQSWNLINLMSEIEFNWCSKCESRGRMWRSERAEWWRVPFGSAVPD